MKLLEKVQSTMPELKVVYEPVKTEVKILDPLDAHKFFMEVWDPELITIQEQVYVLFMDVRKKVIGWKCVGTGSQDHCGIPVKLILSMALKCMADGIIVSHNHPSGNLNESQTDIQIHAEIKQACNLMGIKLLDCLIVSRNDFKSFIDAIPEKITVIENKKELTPGQLELIGLITPLEADQYAEALECVFDRALFHCPEIGINEKDITNFYYTKALYQLFQKISKENQPGNNTSI